MSEPDTKARVVSKSHHTMSLTTTLHTFLGRKVIRITTMPPLRLDRLPHDLRRGPSGRRPDRPHAGNVRVLPRLQVRGALPCLHPP